MAKKGKRYPLVIYDYTLSRWYPATFLISITLFILWWFMPDNSTDPSESWRKLSLLLISGAAFMVTLFLFFMRKAAYVRPCNNHLRLVTPFLRMNISYKRIIKTRATQMSTLFPPSSVPQMQKSPMAAIMSKTAIVVELNKLPISRFFLRFFLSPFFFKDNTPLLIFLVKDWMSFSTELESYRAGGGKSQVKRRKKKSSILSSLSQKK